MNLNSEILQFFVYKRIIKKKDVDGILAECERLSLDVDQYLIAGGYCNDVAATAALGEYYCMPYTRGTCWRSTTRLLIRWSLIF